MVISSETPHQTKTGEWYEALRIDYFIKGEVDEI